MISFGGSVKLLWLAEASIFVNASIDGFDLIAFVEFCCDDNGLPFGYFSLSRNITLNLGQLLGPPLPSPAEMLTIMQSLLASESFVLEIDAMFDVGVFLTTVFNRIYSKVANALQAAWQAVEAFFKQAWTTVSNFFSSVYNDVMNAISDLGKEALSVLNDFGESIAHAIDSLEADIANIIAEVSAVVSNILNDISSFISWLFGRRLLAVPSNVVPGSFGNAQSFDDYATAHHNQLQSVLASAQSAVDTTKSQLGQMPSVADQINGFFELKKFHALLDISLNKACFSSDADFTLLNHNYQYSFEFCTDPLHLLAQALNFVCDLVHLGSLCRVVESTFGISSRRLLLQNSNDVPGDPDSLDKLFSASESTESLLDSVFLSLLQNMTSDTLRAAWLAKSDGVLLRLQSRLSDVRAYTKLFLDDMEAVQPVLAIFRGKKTSVAVAAKSLLPVSSTPFVLTSHCTASLSAVGPACTSQFSMLVYACITSAGTANPQLCTGFFHAFTVAGSAACLSAYTTSCTAEAHALVSDFMRCSDKCAKAISTTLQPACSGEMAARYATLDKSANTTACGGAVQSLYFGACAAQPASCLDLFSAFSASLNRELARRWLKDREHNTTSQHGGVAYLHKKGLLGTVHPSICLSKVAAVQLGNNHLFGLIPACLMQGGSHGKIVHVDLYGNNLTAAMPAVGSEMESIFVSSNALYGNISDRVFANATSLLKLDISNNRFTGSLNILSILPQLQTFTGA